MMMVWIEKVRLIYVRFFPIFIQLKYFRILRKIYQGYSLLMLAKVTNLNITFIFIGGGGKDR